MKVNVNGKGRIPGTNMIAPKKDIDMDRKQILTALSSPVITVYDAETHISINKVNIDKFFEIDEAKQSGVVAEPVVEQEVVVENVPVEEEVVVEEVVVEEPVVVEEVPTVEEVIVEEEIIPEPVVYDEIVETETENTDEVEESSKTYNKKKKKNKH